MKTEFTGICDCMNSV